MFTRAFLKCPSLLKNSTKVIQFWYNSDIIFTYIDKGLKTNE